MSLAALLPPVGFLLLFTAGLGAQATSRSKETRRRLNERFKTALDRHERINFVDLSGPSELMVQHTSEDLVPLSVRVFGYNPARLDLYPMRPWIAIATSLLASSVIACVAVLIVGRLGFLAVLPMWPVVSRMVFGRWHRRRALTLFKQFPDALAMIVRGVRVGIPIGEAIRAVMRDNEPPTSSEFARVADQLAIGLPLDEALRGMAERNGLPEYRFFATALSLQSQTGGNLSATLEGLADVIRKRVAARDRGFALAAEARTSANVLSALPGLLFMTLWVMNPHYVLTLLTERTGHLILGATIVLLGFGIFVMRLLIQKSLS